MYVCVCNYSQTTEPICIKIIPANRASYADCYRLLRFEIFTPTIFKNPKTSKKGRGSSDFYEIWHTDALITTCPGIDIALEGGFDQSGKAGFGVLHASQLVGHAARLLYYYYYCVMIGLTLSRFT